MSDPILIWRFDEAPQELRALSGHWRGGDWLALVPPHLTDVRIGWMESGTAFGRCGVCEHAHPDLAWAGWQVRIGAHA